MYKSSTKICATRSDVPLFNLPSPTGRQTSESSQQTTAQPFLMKVANQPSERRQAFQLCHDVYCRSGLTAGEQQGLRVMRQHLTDTTNVLIASTATEVVFTVTLVGDGEFGLPMESLFGDEVAQMRAAGVRLAEVSCLASSIDADQKRLRFETLVNMISLLIQSARRRGVERLLLAVHPKHAKAYERLFGCVRCSDVKSYAAVRGNPAVLCMHDFADLDIKRYPLFDKVYGPNYAPWQLDGANMHKSEKLFYEQLLPVGDYEVVPVAA